MKSTAFAATLALTLPLLATTSMSALAVSTEQFVNKAAVSDMFEVQTGKLAADKAKSEDVQEFGEQMVDDHTDTTEDLKELVKDEKIDVQMPTSLDERHKEQLDKLKKLSGAEFDRAYVPTQVLAHEQAVNLFEDYSKSGDNDTLKDWASDTLPTLKGHLKEARELNEELSAPAKTAAADDEAMGSDKTMNDKAADQTPADEKKSMDKVTEETDVDGAGNTAMDEKAAAKESKEVEAIEGEKKAAVEKAGMTPIKGPDFEFVTRQNPTDWSTEALIGRNVLNGNGDLLGDINNVIVNEKGKVVAVTIGVGGFLGLGEKDVGVPFSALEFHEKAPVANSEQPDQNKPALTANDDETAISENGEEASGNMDADTEKTAEAEAETQADNEPVETGRFEAEHDEITIVLDATKDQLDVAPTFLWLGEDREKRADAKNDTTVE